MARPRNAQPTPGELELLKILWDEGPCTVRGVLDILKRQQKPRAYTSVMSLMAVMAEKGLLSRKARGKAFVYSARLPREQTLANLVGDLCRRAFEGSASGLVTHLLEGANPTEDELAEIRRTIDEYLESRGESP